MVFTTSYQLLREVFLPILRDVHSRVFMRLGTRIPVRLLSLGVSVCMRTFKI